MSLRPALLLLGGDIPDAALVRRAAKRAGLVVCADGGLRHAAKLGLLPRFVVGDMDSLPRPLPAKRGTIYWCDFDQGRSDFEKSLDFLADVGYPDAYLAGVLGGRLDHALVNLSLVERHAARRRLTVLDRGAAEVLGPGRYRLALKAGELFTLCALAPGARVSLAGARYPLRKAPLAPGSRGLSNVAKRGAALTVHSGRLWLSSPAGPDLRT